MNRVKDKVILITGAAGGLGSAMVDRLLDEGAVVVATDIDLDKLNGTAAANRERYLPLRHDVTNEDAWREVIDHTLRDFGKLDVLINNAGIVIAGSVEETSLEDFRLIQGIHSEGTFLGCKHAMPAMRSTGDGSGSIINMSSVTALGGFPYVFAYSAAKGAIRSMTKSIAAATSADGTPIRCNSVHPGRIETDMVRECREEREKLAGEAEVEAGNPAGVPDDIAHLIVYLASDESVWMNGSELVVDNGATITDGNVALRVQR